MASLPTKRLSYSRRLFIWLLGYSLLLVGCFVIFQYHREKEFKTTEVNSQLQLINNFIIAELDEGKDLNEIDYTDFHPFDQLRVSVLDKSGYIIFDTYPDSMPRQDHSRREEIMKAIAKGSGYAVHRHSESTGETYFYSATRGDDGVIVRTAVPYVVSLDSLLKADYGFLWIMGAVTLIMCTLGYFATRRVGQHIIRLNRFAQSAEKGVRVSDIEPFPHDELGEISNHIIRLYAELQQAYADRDREHRISLHEQQEKERIKKQLTNNINHELKTPVASIQVCLETMISHPDITDAKRMEFLQRSLAHCERLKKLLADVSLITRMDDGGTAIVKEEVNLTEIIAEAVADKQALASSRGMRIDNNVSAMLRMNGNPTLLMSIFNNLIDNAIAYSGGTKITISPLSIDSTTIALSFADDGIGVAEEHFPRLFERFYRIDKGRSRAAGGTGLGLSIVKNAVLMHGGSITVANAPTGGLTFTITLGVSGK